MEDERRQETLLKVKSALEKRSDKLLEEEYQAIKLLYKEIPELDIIPKTLWLKAAHLFYLKQFAAGEKVISSEDRYIQWYIVLTGVFTTSEMQELHPGDTFGDFGPVNKKKWIHIDVTAKKVSTVAFILPRDLAYLIDQGNADQSHKALISFLSEAIPKFGQLSGCVKYRLARRFTERTFGSRAEVLPEGSNPNHAYLIKEGKCKILARKSQLYSTKEDECTTLEELKRRARNQISSKSSQRGYISSSTTRCQIMTIGEKQWFCEEALFEDIPWKEAYSVVTTVKTTVLIISREEFSKFPRDVVEEMRKNTKERIQWQAERVRELSLSLMKINKLDSNYSCSETPKKINKSFKRFPVEFRENVVKYGTKEVNLKRDVKTACARPRTPWNFPKYNSRSRIQSVMHVNTYLNEGEWDNSGNASTIDTRMKPKKHVLQAASMFKTAYNNKMLCPVVMCTFHPLKQLKRNLQTKPQKKLAQKGYRVQNKFVIGVKEVKVLNVEAPLSPNFARIHGN